jgi:signal transduction histidine kinase
MDTTLPSGELLRQSWRSWLSPDQPRVGPFWLQHLWTIVFSMVVAAAFTLTGFAFSAHESEAWSNLPLWGRWYGATLIISLTISYMIRYAFVLLWAALGPRAARFLRGWPRGAITVAMVLLGMQIGCLLANLATGLGIAPFWEYARGADMFAGAIMSFMVSFVFYQFFVLRGRQIKAERAAAIARLALLQGQIEPHFLFNTLANVVGLMDTDTPRAKHMLESFVDYLRASLGGLRRERHTLGDEIDLVDAYLRILKVRMDDRLAYRIDVPDALRRQSLPPLLLQPLVENAIVHGLEPKIDGGCVVVRAVGSAGQLVLSVEDDGLGLAGASSARPSARGSGSALANIRERLTEVYGGTASLQLDGAAPHGVRARLTLPLALEAAS